MGGLLERPELEQEFDQPLHRPAAGADPFRTRLPVVHLQERLDLEHGADRGHGEVHPPAAAQEFERIQRGEYVRPGDLFFQLGQDLLHRPPMSGQFRGFQHLKAHPQAELARIEHRHPGGGFLGRLAGDVHHSARLLGNMDRQNFRSALGGQPLVFAVENLRAGDGGGGRGMEGRHPPVKLRTGHFQPSR
jgi:hypothetical protein